MCNHRLLSFLVVACAVLALAAENARADTFDARGVRIYYTVHGCGEAVVLIHGLHSNGLANWRLPGTVAELARDHQVIVLDLPGHGRSDRPNCKDAYGAQMAEDVVLLLDHLQIDKAHVVGYSLGGMITMKLLATHPERIRSATVGGMGWFKEGTDSGLQNLRKRLRHALSGPPPAFFEADGSLALSEKDVKNIKVPVEVILGDSDFVIKRINVIPLQDIRPDWPVVEICDADHITCIGKRQFRDEIAAWVRKNSK